MAPINNWGLGTMVITNAIVHEVIKEQNSERVTRNLRQEELPIGSQVCDLMTRTQSLFDARSGRAYGEFADRGSFALNLTDLLSGAVDFTEWSIRAIASLESELQATRLATGGHMFFSMYEVDGAKYVFVAMLKHTSGISFNDQLDILDVKHLDLEKLHLAARISVDEWRTADPERYVAFVKGKANRDIRDYFLRFLSINMETLEDSARNTSDLVETVKGFTRDLSPEQANRVSAQVVEHCTALIEANEPFEIEVLANVISPDDPSRFLAFASQDSYQVQNEFLLDERKLKGLMRISGGQPGLSISFDMELLNDVVFYNSERLYIEPIPDNIRRQLPGLDE